MISGPFVYDCTGPSFQVGVVSLGLETSSCSINEVMDYLPPRNKASSDLFEEVSLGLITILQDLDPGTQIDPHFNDQAKFIIYGE